MTRRPPIAPLACALAALAAAFAIHLMRGHAAPAPPAATARPTAYASPAYVISDTPAPLSACTADAELEILRALAGVDPSAMSDAQVTALVESVPRPYSCAALTDAQWRALLAGEPR